MAQFLESANPVRYIDRLTRLTGLSSLAIHHKPLKYAAEFKTPCTIYVDFRQTAKYISLCIAHEYSHLLLRRHEWSRQPGIVSIISHYPQPSAKYNYTEEGVVEQILAILLQLSYEDKFNIRKFSSRRARELMETMGVWPAGKDVLNRWPDFLTGRLGLLPWLKKMFSES